MLGATGVVDAFSEASSSADSGSTARGMHTGWTSAGVAGEAPDAPAIGVYNPALDRRATEVTMNRQRDATPPQPGLLREAISLRLALLGFPLPPDAPWTPLLAPILAREREQNRRLAFRLSPTDARIQRFLDDYLAETGPAPNLPRRTLVLDEPGLARDLSLPSDGDRFTSPLLHAATAWRNGVLHNPANDRRTTAGVFHIAEGGLPIPDDKIAVPKVAFARLLARAFDAARGLDWLLPYTANQPEPAGCFVSLLLRPLVVPEVPGVTCREADGDPLLRARRPGRQPRLRRGHLRQRRRPLPARERRVARPRAPGPATPAASSSPRT